jgi:hypothetical protein
MLKNNLKYISLLMLVLIMSCAKGGTITGGLKTQLFYIKISFPENFNTNFKGNEIKLVFDENVKLKNLNN